MIGIECGTKRKRNKGSESPITETVSTLAPNAIPSDPTTVRGPEPGRRVVETRGYDGPRHRKGSDFNGAACNAHGA